MDVVSAGRDPQDALDMIADAIYEALVDGVTPVNRSAEECLGELYEEMIAAGLPMATAVVSPAPYLGE